MNSDMIWEEPERSLRGRWGAMAEWVERLKERPGDWARYPVPRRSPSTGYLHRRFPGAEWTSRAGPPDAPRDRVLYGRWVGEAPLEARVAERDPDLQRLLDEEAEIERRTRGSHGDPS